jgi:hypothetical protein
MKNKDISLQDILERVVVLETKLDGLDEKNKETIKKFTSYTYAMIFILVVLLIISINFLVLPNL